MATTKKTSATTPRKKVVRRGTVDNSTPPPVTEALPVNIALAMLTGINKQINLIFGNTDPKEYPNLISGYKTLQQTCKTLGDKFFTPVQLELVSKTLARIEKYYKDNPLQAVTENYYQKIDSSYFFTNQDTISLAEAYFYETNVKVTPKQMCDYLNISLAMSHMAPEDKYEEVPWDQIIFSKDGALNLPDGCPSLVEVQGDLSLNQAMYHMANKCPHTSKNYILKWLKNAVAIYSFVENAFTGVSNKALEFLITEEEWNQV